MPDFCEVIKTTSETIPFKHILYQKFQKEYSILPEYAIVMSCMQVLRDFKKGAKIIDIYVIMILNMTQHSCKHGISAIVCRFSDGWVIFVGIISLEKWGTVFFHGSYSSKKSSFTNYFGLKPYFFSYKY